MDEVYDAIASRFDGNARLVQYGRALYRAGDVKTEEPPYVTCLVAQTEDLSTFACPVYNLTADFVIRARGPTSERCARIASELYRTFHEKTWEADGVHVNGMRMRSRVASARDPDSETVTYMALMTFDVMASLMAPMPAGVE